MCRDDTLQLNVRKQGQAAKIRQALNTCQLSDQSAAVQGMPTEQLNVWDTHTKPAEQSCSPAVDSRLAVDNRRLAVGTCDHHTASQSTALYIFLEPEAGKQHCLQ